MPPGSELGQSDLVFVERPASEICGMLDHMEWLKEFHWAQLETLAKHMRSFSVHKGKFAFREGAVESYVCWVATGKIAIVKEDSRRRKSVLAAVGPGQAFGELSLVDHEPRSATAIAVEDSTILVLTQAGFERLVDDAPRLAVMLLLKIARLVSQRLRKTSGALVEHLKK